MQRASPGAWHIASPCFKHVSIGLQRTGVEQGSVTPTQGTHLIPIIIVIILQLLLIAGALWDTVSTRQMQTDPGEGVSFPRSSH